MRKKRFYFILLLLLCTQVNYSQSKKLKCIILDELNKPLKAVTIFNLNNLRSSITNERGEFEIPLDSLPIVLILTHVGYETDTLEVNVNFFVPNYQIFMRPLVNPLPEVVVGDQAGFIVLSAVEKGLRTLIKFNIQRHYTDIFSPSTEPYKSLSAYPSYRNDHQIAKNANNYNESQWINIPMIKLTSSQKTGRY